jgi:hypothetical protein
MQAQDGASERGLSTTPIRRSGPASRRAASDRLTPLTACTTTAAGACRSGAATRLNVFLLKVLHELLHLQQRRAHDRSLRQARTALMGCRAQNTRGISGLADVLALRTARKEAALGGEVDQAWARCPAIGLHRLLRGSQARGVARAARACRDVSGARSLRCRFPILDHLDPHT